MTFPETHQSLDVQHWLPVQPCDSAALGRIGVRRSQRLPPQGRGGVPWLHRAAAPWEMSLNVHTPQGVRYVVGTGKSKEIAQKILKHSYIFIYTSLAFFFFLNTFLSTAVIGFTGPNS